MRDSENIKKSMKQVSINAIRPFDFHFPSF